MIGFMQMSPKNGNILIQVVDNLIKDQSGFSFIQKRGKINNDQIQVSNEGLLNGKRVWYYNYATYQFGDNLLLPEKNIFMLEDKVISDGVVVQPRHFKQTSGGFVHCEQDFFEVKYSNVESVKVGNVVIVQERTSYKFNRDGGIYFYVPTDNIMLNISKAKGIEPGRNKKLLERIDCVFGGTEKGCGMCDGIKYYFTRSIAEIELDKVYFLVSKDDIYGCDR